MSVNNSDELKPYGGRHDLMPITGKDNGVGPKNISISQLNSVYQHYCDYEIEEGRVVRYSEGGLK